MQQVIGFHSVVIHTPHLHLPGFTGRLVTKQLINHRNRASFTLALAARSHDKLTEVATALNLDDQVSLLTLDVTKADEVENAVKSAKVVVNTVGPYWLWGTPVVQYVLPQREVLSIMSATELAHRTAFIMSTSQVRHHSTIYTVAHLNITAETVWVKEMINQ